jgi:hypothetical protein
MINKLEMFFPNQPNSTTRFAAFMLWLNSAAKIAVKDAIVFNIGRKHMIEAATQLFENPTQKLLPTLQNAPLATKIERFLKRPKFSLMHLGSPSQAPSPFKKQRLNLNTPPSEHAGQGGCGRSPGERGFIPRGNSKGFRGRGSGRSYTPRGVTKSASPSSPGTAGAERTPAGDRPSPLKRRVLLWEDN